MTPRQALNDFLSRHIVAVLAFVFAFGGAWAVLQAQVARKADRAEVEAIARDIRTIRNLLCRQAAGDSYCTVQPPERP